MERGARGHGGEWGQRGHRALVAEVPASATPPRRLPGLHGPARHSGVHPDVYILSTGGNLWHASGASGDNGKDEARGEQ